jgi:hypothetical protein
MFFLFEDGPAGGWKSAPHQGWGATDFPLWRAVCPLVVDILWFLDFVATLYGGTLA